MCNFSIQELNRGAVLFGLPDNSGKLRPMILLNDVRPNERAMYGMNINAVPIGTKAYNKYALPVVLWDKRDREKVVSYINTVAMIQFHPSDFSSFDFRCSGICPAEILDLAVRIHVAHVSGTTADMESLATEVRKKWVEFLTHYTWVDGIIYRDTKGDTIKFLKDGSEEVVETSPYTNLQQRIEIPEEAVAAVQEKVVTPTPVQEAPPVKLEVKPTKVEKPKKEKKGKKRGKTVLVKKNQAGKKVIVSEHKRGVYSILPATTVNVDKEVGVYSNMIGDTDLWVRNKRTVDIDTEILIDFLKARKIFKVADISNLYNLKSNFAVYDREKAVVDVLSKRVTEGKLNLVQVGYLKKFHAEKFPENIWE